MKVHGEEFEKFYRVEDPWKVLNKNVRNYVLKKTFKKHLKSVDKIIEIGCGEGNYSSYINKFVKNCNGIDISHTAIERAKSLQLKNYIFKQDDLSNVDYSKYDAVIALEVIYYLSAEEQNKWWQTVRKNDLIIFSAPIIGENQFRKYFTDEKLKRLFKRLSLKVIDERNLSFDGTKSLKHRILNKLLFSNFLCENYLSYKILQTIPSNLIYQKVYVLTHLS